MNFLEQLVCEYLDWQGYIVKNNIHVGKLPRGGYAMELDVVAFHPKTNHLLHIETSMDADSWPKRSERYHKKFASGREFIFEEVFTWLENTEIDQVAIFTSRDTNGKFTAGGRVMSMDDLASIIRHKIEAGLTMSKGAIPERYPILRSLQLLVKGFNGVVKSCPEDLVQ